MILKLIGMINDVEDMGFMVLKERVTVAIVILCYVAMQQA